MNQLNPRTIHRAVVHRWPALLGAVVVTAIVPLVAFAEEFGSSQFQSFNTGTAVTVINSSSPNPGTALSASSAAGNGIETNGHIGLEAFGSGADGVGVRAHEISATAVEAASENAIAIKAAGKTVGVQARAKGSDQKIGVAVDADGNQAGLKANSTSGTGVQATSSTGTAIDASSTFAAAIHASGKTGGVNASSSEGVAVRASGTTGGVIAQATAANSSGVSAFGFGANSPGLFAQGTIGAELSGSEAPLRLDPANTPGAPTVGPHKRGELYVDSTGDLFYCKADGMPGTWKQVLLK